MKKNIHNALELSCDLFQNIILRLTTSNTSQRKSRQQLIIEHERLESYINKTDKFVRNISESTLSLQLHLKLSIVDLKVDNVPTGRFLLCRVLTKLMRLNAIITLVED